MCICVHTGFLLTTVVISDTGTHSHLLRAAISVCCTSVGVYVHTFSLM